MNGYEKWTVFTGDGNWYYCGDKPDFEAILAIVFSFEGIAPNQNESLGQKYELEISNIELLASEEQSYYDYMNSKQA